MIFGRPFDLVVGGRRPLLRWCNLGKMLFQEQVPLAPYTTFQIGGPARWFAEATTEEDVVEAVNFARNRALPLFVLGGGSNVLISDNGFPGLVVHIALLGIAEEEDGEGRIFTAAAGEDWDKFVATAIDHNCAGIECLAGIPGTVGGTPVQNVGAYGQEVATTIQTVRALDTQTLRFVDLDRAFCGFEYRKSIFNTTERERFIVTAATFRLLSDGRPMISYADLKHRFKQNKAPSVREVEEAVREIRRAKGMLITPGDPDSQSAGSFFKNPVISSSELERIQTAAVNPDQTVPNYPAGEGKAKIPAAWLVEQAGFHKGFEWGRAGISSRHTLALINRGGAVAADILSLRDRITAAVANRFGILLEPEPVWVD